MKRRFLTGLLAALLLLTLAACSGGSAGHSGSSSGSASADTSAPADGGYTESLKESFQSNTSMDMVVTAPSAPMEEAVAELAPDAGGERDIAASQTGQKLIRTAWLEMEATSFDAAVDALAALTKQFNGYFENSSVANHKDGARWADYTVRVPAEQYDAFLSQAGELCHLTWRETSQDDVSEVYYDTQGRLKTQQIKLERLQALLAKAELMEDIITIESAISETEWQIDELSGTLRHYDGKVNYATVHINIREVYKFSDVEQVPDSFGARMSAAFSGGISSFVNNLENLAVAFAYSWMWWLLVILIVATAVCLVRKKIRNRPAVHISPRWMSKENRSEDDKPQ